jgi:hypothetical protein
MWRILSFGSAQAEKRQNGEDDDNGSDEPDDAVHFSSPENLSIERAGAQANPTRLRTAITITTAPTNQMMLFILVLLVMSKN